MNSLQPFRHSTHTICCYSTDNVGDLQRKHFHNMHREEILIWVDSQCLIPSESYLYRSGENVSKFRIFIRMLENTTGIQIR